MSARKITRVFVAGTWNTAKAAPYQNLAESLGRSLAEHGFDLTTGPGTGISAAVIEGFKSVSNRGVLRTYLPTPEAMRTAGEKVIGEFDELIQTKFDYPMRNVLHIKESDALVVITGGDGTLEECLPALIDYDLPTIVVRDSGLAPRALHWLADHIFPEWSQLLTFVDSSSEIIETLIQANSSRVYSDLPRHQ